MHGVRADPYRAARELWAIRQLVGFGFEFSARRFLQLVSWLACVAIVLAGAAGVLVLQLGSELLVGDAGSEATRLRVKEGLALVIVAATVYVAALDLVRGSLTALRTKVSESPLRGLWAALDISRTEAVLAERGVGVAIRSLAMAAVVAGASLELARSGSAAAADALIIGCCVGLFHGATVTGLALLHASRSARPAAGVWSWAVSALLALAAGALAAVIAPENVDSGGARAHLLGFVLAFDAERWFAIVAMSMLVPVAISVVVFVLGVAVAERSPVPHAPGAREARPESGAARSTHRMVEIGTGAARRSTAVRRLVGGAVAVAAAVIGWRLAGGSALPGADIAGRILAVYAVFAAAVVSSTAVTVAGQGATLDQLRFWWEQGIRTPALYLATISVALHRAIPLQLAVVALAAAAWGMFPWRAVVVILAVVLGDFLVDSLFARPHMTDGSTPSDPASGVASIGLVVVLGVLSFRSGMVTSAALLVLTVAIAGAGPWMFRSRLKQTPVVTA